MDYCEKSAIVYLSLNVDYFIFNDISVANKSPWYLEQVVVPFDPLSSIYIAGLSIVQNPTRGYPLRVDWVWGRIESHR